MANERFRWSNASKIEACLELYKRAEADANCVRSISTDSELICVACGKKPKRKDICVYPSRGLPTSNKTIGHKDCVYREVAQFTAKHSAAHEVVVPAETKNARSAQRVIDTRKPAKGKYQSTIETSPIDELLALSANEIFERIQTGLDNGRTYQEGYERGCKETAAKIAMLLRARGIDI